MGEALKTVDVIIPAYNAERFIGATIDSVLAQTHLPKKIIIVDDGSTDNTVEIVNGYNSPLIEIISLENGGVSRARNVGIKASTADYIAFLDSDDTWQPEKLEAQLRQLQANPKAGVCYSGTQAIDEFDAKIEGAIGIPFVQGKVFEDILFYDLPIYGSASSIIVARDVLLQTELFDETMQFSEDVDLWANLALLTEFVYVAEPHVNIRENPYSATRTRSWEKNKQILLQNLYYKNKFAEKYRFPVRPMQNISVEIFRLFYGDRKKVREFKKFYREFKTTAPALSRQMETNNIASFGAIVVIYTMPEIMRRIAGRPQKFDQRNMPSDDSDKADTSLEKQPEARDA